MEKNGEVSPTFFRKSEKGALIWGKIPWLRSSMGKISHLKCNFYESPGKNIGDILSCVVVQSYEGVLVRRKLPCPKFTPEFATIFRKLCFTRKSRDLLLVTCLLFTAIHIRFSKMIKFILLDFGQHYDILKVFSPGYWQIKRSLAKITDNII